MNLNWVWSHNEGMPFLCNYHFITKAEKITNSIKLIFKNFNIIINQFL